MPTYRSDVAGTNYRPWDFPPGATHMQPFSLPVSVAPVNTDIFILGKIPLGATLMGFEIELPQLDTNGAPTATLQVGTSGSAARFVAASNIARVAGRVSSGLSPTLATNMIGAIFGSLPYTPTAADDLRITISAAVATGGTGGTIKGHFTYVMTGKYQLPR